jgi:hypothetical protein
MIKKKFKNLDSILEELKNKFREVHINSSNLINVLKNIIEIVELIKIKGSDKKIYAINLLRLLINDYTMEKKDKKLCMDILDNNIISDMIDIIVLASKNKIKINKNRFKISKISKKISSHFRKASLIQSRSSDKRRRSKE